MKRFRVSTRFFFIILVLIFPLFTVFSLSDTLCWGADDTNSVTVQHIAQNIKAEDAKMSNGNIILAVQTVIKESLHYGVDYRLILAIMKTESNYRQNVISPDGARGFMQIQPSTASEIAKEIGIPYRGLKDLCDPQMNIRMGIYYISKMIDLFNDLPTALFAYNVGHNKAKRLMAEDKDPNTTYTKRVIAEYTKNKKNMVRL
ncbi:MAG: lytic transglycosylase domain-containing protein [Deltaproteobacteria bacterium]|nr:lytic transglycosylase domain-containing protein [Deltaproteobacteria bacterium]